MRKWACNLLYFWEATARSVETCVGIAQSLCQLQITQRNLLFFSNLQCYKTQATSVVNSER